MGTLDIRPSSRAADCGASASRRRQPAWRGAGGCGTHLQASWDLGDRFEPQRCVFLGLGGGSKVV